MENQALILLIGEIKGTLEIVKTRVDSIDNKVDTLPCVTHTSQLDVLENWKKNCNGIKQTEQTEKLKGGISLKNSLIIGLITFIFGILLAVITNLVMR